MHVFGIRREDKNPWEARVPLTPEHVAEIMRACPVRFVVQPSRLRAFPDEAYRAIGAEVAEDLSGCSFICAVKEIPPPLVVPGKAYMFFSHTHKGQPYNMPLLKALHAGGCTVIDYEFIRDAQGVQAASAFSVFAGINGMIETLCALRDVLDAEGVEHPFAEIRRPLAYASLADAECRIARLGELIRRHGLPGHLHPFVGGFLGYGNVSRGAQKIYDLLPVQELSPAKLLDDGFMARLSPRSLYKVVFHEEDVLIPRAAGASFSLNEYYASPERYAPAFERYLPSLSLLLNGVYWEEKYPRLVTKAALRELFQATARPRLKVIGDVSADINGAIECTEFCTTPEHPVFTYDPRSGHAAIGVSGHGLAVMAVDNLPCEMPKDASRQFGDKLKAFFPALAQADFSRGYGSLDVPEEIRRGIILLNGTFAPAFEYMRDFIQP